MDAEGEASAAPGGLSVPGGGCYSCVVSISFLALRSSNIPCSSMLFSLVRRLRTNLVARITASTAPITAQHAEPMIKINSVFDIEVPQNISVLLDQK